MLFLINNPTGFKMKFETKLKIVFIVITLSVLGYVVYKEYIKDYLIKMWNVEAFHQAVEDATKSTLRSDTIFLGYRFGMDEDEYKIHEKALLENGELYLNDASNVAYKFKLSAGKATAILDPLFKDGKLNMLLLSVNSDKENRLAILMKLDLQIHYIGECASWKGFTRYNETMDEIGPCFWIKNNKMISVSGSSSCQALVKYEDLTSRN